MLDCKLKVCPEATQFVEDLKAKLGAKNFYIIYRRRQVRAVHTVIWIRAQTEEVAAMVHTSRDKLVLRVYWADLAKTKGEPGEDCLISIEHVSSIYRL